MKITIVKVDPEDSNKGYYFMENNEEKWTDEMIEGLVEEEVKVEPEFNLKAKIINNRVVVDIPSEYQFKDENGNIINATKIVLEKKKKEYPKTFLGCCDVLGIEDLISRGVKGYKAELLDTFQKLLICRDAYWKIVGEEMGLGKSWEPMGMQYVFSICRQTNEVVKSGPHYCGSHTFEFPTEEMRDAFYENFKELIEQCKELL